MGILNHQNISVSVTPKLPENSQVSVEISPYLLFLSGFNLPVEISTASRYRNPPQNMPLTSIVVMAHFDTGASITAIDISLAKHLNLITTGMAKSRTASGPQVMPTFAVDISFPNSTLSPFRNLHINSCNLGFDISKNINNPIRLNEPRNFALLIGRDIMSRWNITWNGPTSTVFVSD
ncbi:MAG: retropepsin-like domain-containing protein [Treponema sp.]|nr:retropepsin-like domain-containing protein [Treponema sp.]